MNSVLHPAFQQKSTEDLLRLLEQACFGYLIHVRSFANWLLGLVARFSLRVREVPGSIPGAALILTLLRVIDTFIIEHWSQNLDMSPGLKLRAPVV